MGKKYVYKLTFPDRMVYIGIADSVEKRWANDGRNYKGQKVYDAIKAYGWDNVQKEIVLYLSDNEEVIRSVETALIEENKGNCYNDTFYEPDPVEEKELDDDFLEIIRDPNDIPRHDMIESFTNVMVRKKIGKKKSEEYLKRLEHGKPGFDEVRAVADELGVHISLTIYDFGDVREEERL